MSIGQAIGGIGGAIIGFVTGGPAGALKGAYWGYTAGTLIDPPPGPHTEGPRLNDRGIQISEDGAPLPTVFGTVRLAGNVIWSTGLEEIATTEEVGGGSGGGGATSTTYTYRTDAAIALCAGEITGVRRIWADTKLIYDASETAGLEPLLASSQRFENIRVYTGTSTQQPDPLIQAVEGAYSAPAFREIAYVVFENLELADFGNRLPNFSFEIVKSGSVGNVTLEYDYQYTDSGTYKQPNSATYISDSGAYVWKMSSATNVLNVDFIPFGSTPVHHKMIDVETYRSMPWWLASSFEQYIAKGKSDINACGIPIKVGALYGIGVCLIDGSYKIFTPSVATTSAYYFNIKNGYVYFSTGYSTTNNFFFRGNLSTGEITQITHAVTEQILGIESNLEYIFVYVQNKLLKYSVADLSLVSTLLLTELSTASLDVFTVDDNNNVFFLYGNKFAKYSSNGVLTNYNELSGISISAFFYNYSLFIIANGNVFAYWTAQQDSNFGKLRYYATNRLQTLTTTLQSVCNTLSAASGIDPAEYDYTALSGDTVRGYTLSKPLTMRGALEPLQAAWQWDLSEVDGQLKAIKRGGAIAATLTDADLGAAESPTGMTLQLTRNNETELPSEIQISYSDIDNDYHAGTQYARSLTAQHTQLQQISLPLVMNSQEAAQLADTLLGVARWSGAHSLAWSCTYAHARLAPGDVVSVPGHGRTWKARIEQIDMGMPGLVQVQAVPDMGAIYTSYASASDAAGIGQTLSLNGATTLALLDCCMLRDTDTGLGWYVALSSTASGWRGGLLYKSSDGGATWVASTSATKDMAASYGTATTLLASADHRVWDKANSLTVRMVRGEPSSATETAVLDGANPVLVGAHGRWELIQFQTATQNVDETWTLSNLLRGRRGTEWAIGLHAIGDTVVFPTASSLTGSAMEASELDAERLYRAVTVGSALESVEPEAHTYTGERLMPLAPADFAALPQPNGDIRLQWTRRDRIARAWNSSAALPMSETAESYEIDVLVDGVVVQTLTAATNSLVYANLDQTEYETGSSVTFNLYQISALVGRGHAAQATCTSTQTAIYTPIVVPDENAVVIGDETTPRYLIDDGTTYLSIAGNGKVYTSAIPGIDEYESTLPIPFQTTFGPQDAQNVATLTGKYLVAYGDRLAVTSDFVTWTTSTLTTASYNYIVRQVISDGTQFVIVDGYGKVYSSSNGSTWTLKYTAPAGLWIMAIANDGSSEYIMVGEDRRVSPAVPYVATSSDLITWTEHSPTLTTYMGVTISATAPDTIKWLLNSVVYASPHWYIGGMIMRYIDAEDSYRFYPLAVKYNGTSTFNEISPYVGVSASNSGKTVETICLIGNRLQLIGMNMLMSQSKSSPTSNGWEPANIQPDQAIAGARVSLAAHSADRAIVYLSSTQRHYIGDGSTIWS